MSAPKISFYLSSCLNFSSSNLPHCFTSQRLLHACVEDQRPVFVPLVGEGRPESAVHAVSGTLNGLCRHAQECLDRDPLRSDAELNERRRIQSQTTFLPRVMAAATQLGRQLPFMAMTKVTSNCATAPRL